MTVVDTRGEPGGRGHRARSGRADDAAALDAKADAPATVIRAALADRNGSLLAHELGCARARPGRGARDPAVRRVVAAGLGADVPRRARGDGRRRGARRPHRRRRAAALRAPRRGARATPRTYEQQELPPPLAEPRLDFRRLFSIPFFFFLLPPIPVSTSASTPPPRSRTRCRRRVHPGDRRRGQAVLRLPRVPPRASSSRGSSAGSTRRRRGRSWARRTRSPGCRGSSTTSTRTRSSRSSATPSAGTTRSALACTAKYYEDKGYPGHVNCTENFNGQVDALRDRAAQGLGGAQLLLQHGLRREQRLRHGRAVVAPRRLRAAAGDDRPRVRVVGVPRRHRPRERLADHAESTCACTRPTTRSRWRSRAA